jgi:uncharacterized protein (DUF1697 family)
MNYVALLRAVNLGTHKKVSMSDLRSMTSGLGFEDVQTLLQSGNLVFSASGKTADIERKLEAEAEKRLRLKTEFMVRTAREWDAIVAGNPFPREAKSDPAHLVVMVCKQAPPKSPKVTGVGREVLRVKGREIYVVYPDGIGRSRLKIDVLCTGRNWNTVLKLANLSKT